MAKKKRKWKGTPAQRAALKKGQAALAKWRKTHGNPKRKKKAARKKKATRRRNPTLARNVRSQLGNAVRLYQKFREAEPRYVDSLKANPLPRVAMEIGRLDGVLYTTTHAGKATKYIHKFTGRSRPVLATDGKGKQLYILGGAYDFTEDGIVDKKV